MTNNGFIHRPNNDGNVDSICLKLFSHDFRTIASNKHEIALAAVEAKHECEPADLIRIQGWMKDRPGLTESV